LIRSKDIPVRDFADGLTQYKQLANSQGCPLMSINDDLEMEALMQQADKE